MKDVAARLASLSQKELRDFSSSGEVEISLADSKIKLSGEELEVQKIEKEGFAVESDGGITVALNTLVTDELKDEGFAREIVNKIQNMRKTSGFEVTDRIDILVCTAEPLKSAVNKYNDFICHETLADTMRLMDKMPSENGGTNWNINGIKADIAVIRK